MTIVRSDDAINRYWHKMTGEFPADGTWHDIPGTFFEARAISKILKVVDFAVEYGPQEAMGTVDIFLSHDGGRAIFQVTTQAKDRSAGDVIGDATLLHLGVFTVRWSHATPPAPVKPIENSKKDFPYGTYDPAKHAAPAFKDEDDWTEALRAEGWSEDQIDALFLDEIAEMFPGDDQSYTPKSAQPKPANSDPDRWDED